MDIFFANATWNSRQMLTYCYLGCSEVFAIAKLKPVEFFDFVEIAKSNARENNELFRTLLRLSFQWWNPSDWHINHYPHTQTDTFDRHKIQGGNFWPKVSREIFSAFFFTSALLVGRSLLQYGLIFFSILKIGHMSLRKLLMMISERGCSEKATFRVFSPNWEILNV